MLFKSLCCEIIMEHKESTSVKIMVISAEVLLTKEGVTLTIPLLKSGINTHPRKVMCVILRLLGLLVLSLGIIKGFCPIKTRLKAKVGKLF